jgi:hypothetical protein
VRDSIDYSLKEAIIDMFDSFKEAVIRFFDNRFVTRNEQLELLRLELEKERAEKNKLLDYILMLNKVNESIDNREEPQPLRSSVPWHTKQRELEKRDLELVRQRNIQAEMKMDAGKSTEELEQELLG